MLKEQLLNLAMKTLTKAYEAKEIIEEQLKSDIIQNYIKGVRDTANWMIENSLDRIIKVDDKKAPKSKPTKKVKKVATKAAKSSPKQAKKAKASHLNKVVRKSSIRAAKEIASSNADTILQSIKKDSLAMVKKNDSLNGKKSLAYLVWALGHAERAKIKEGISVHDVSALLYRASKIELYPINISRVLHSNNILVRQAGADEQSKTYLLTDEGKKIFNEKFLTV